MRTRREAPSIMILGGNFVGLGAEAMMSVVAQTIRDSIPDAMLCALVYNNQDRSRFQALGVFPVRMRPRGRIAKRLYPWLRDRTLIARARIHPGSSPHGGLFNPFFAADVVVDISGFATGDSWGARAAYQRWQTSQDVKYAGATLIYMPQSWGPFTDLVVAKYAGRMLGNADLIFAREQAGHDALLALEGVDPQKVNLAPDIAFQFKPLSPDTAESALQDTGIQPGAGPLIGITPNIRIYERTQGQGAQNAYVKSLTSTILSLRKEADAHILLIPHERWPDRPDDNHLIALLLETTQEHSGRVFAIGGRNDAAETKAIIGRLDFLIASRYHSLVAAISRNVPVAVVGWADKYDELMSLVGLGEWCVDPVRQETSEIDSTLCEAWNNREKIAAALAAAAPTLSSSSRQSLDGMLRCIESSLGLAARPSTSLRSSPGRSPFP